MPEWSNGAVLKTAVRAIVPGVRIPLSPPKFAEQILARSRLSAFGGGRIRHFGIDVYYVYILLSEAKTRTYTGVADDVEKRLKEHNDGKVISSRPYRPYKIMHTESFETLREARQKEKFYKSTTGRKRLRVFLLAESFGPKEV